MKIIKHLLPLQVGWGWLLEPPGSVTTPSPPAKVPARGVCTQNAETNEANISFITLEGTGFSWQTLGESASVPRWEEIYPMS